MLCYDFDILRLPPLSHYGGGRIEAHFRDRSTAQAFRKAPGQIREWLLSAGFRDKVSGSVLLPGRYDAKDEIMRAAILSKLEMDVPRIGGAEFDVRTFITQSLRAQPEAIPEQPARQVQVAPFWTTQRAASG